MSLESDVLIHKLVRRARECNSLYEKYQIEIEKADPERSIILERVRRTKCFTSKNFNIQLIAENLHAQELTRKKLATLANSEWEKGTRTPIPVKYPKVRKLKLKTTMLKISFASNLGKDGIISYIS